jgi:hypothetical protein
LIETSTGRVQQTCPDALPDLNPKRLSVFDKDKNICTNVPMLCPLCPPKEEYEGYRRAIWKYNWEQHCRKAHKGKSSLKQAFEEQFEISRMELLAMEIDFEEDLDLYAQTGLDDEDSVSEDDE